MIVFRSGEVLILGVTRQNIDRLVGGEPIRIRRDTHGPGVPEGLTIGIVFGEQEGSVLGQLREAGVITDETVEYRTATESGRKGQRFTPGKHPPPQPKAPK